MSAERDFGRFEGEVLARLSSIESFLKQLAELDKRLQEVEKHQAQIKLIASLFGTVAGAAVGVLIKLLVK